MKKNKCINIGLVRSTYYEKIEFNMHAGAMFVIDSHNRNNKLFEKYKIQYQNIPASGSFEIPNLISKHIDKFDAFVAIGCIIRGKTPHFDFISKSITDGLMKISIESKKPIGNAVLTCLNKKQAIERSDWPTKKNKGFEAAKAIMHSLITSHWIENDLDPMEYEKYVDPSIYDEK